MPNIDSSSASDLSSATPQASSQWLKQHQLLHELLNVCRTDGASGPQSILQRAVDIIRYIFEADRCLICFYSADNYRVIWGAIAHSADVPPQNRHAYYPEWNTIQQLIQQHLPSGIWVTELPISAPVEQSQFHLKAKSSAAKAVLSSWTQPASAAHNTWIGGFISVEDWQPGRVWQLSEKYLLHIAIHQVEQAVYQALLIQQAEERLQRTSLLQHLTAQIRESLDLSHIFATVTTELGQLVLVDHCNILQYLPEQRIWRGLTEYRSHADVPSGLDIVIPDENNPFSAQLRNLQIVQVSDTRQIDDPINRQFAETYCGAWLMVPIHHNQTLWGAIAFTQHGCPRHWHPSEIEFLNTVAGQLAIAIHQATLYQHIQQHNQSLAVQIAQQTEQLQNALIAADAAAQAKNEFLATISHELRTPLMPVIGMSSALLRQFVGSLNPKQTEYLKIVHDSGHQLLKLINDILDFVKIRAGVVSLQVTEFPLHRAIAQSVEAMQPEANRKTITLHVELQGITKSTLFCGDERRISQILQSLLSNAIKFTPMEGQVWLRSSLQGSRILLEVEDTGIGIPAEQQSLLFEAFQQADGALNREYEGIGLGLALTKQLIELHGGSIRLRSKEGVGSTFFVEIEAQPLPTLDRSELI